MKELRGCFIACGKFSEITEGRHKGLRIEGPEYETIYAFGGPSSLILTHL
ncbi:MAG: hypothetical protein JRJ71_15925 [Deltaproteobacteria bacterium]|nr:hypothetical protein [Deltaproteobacteria bacterium]